ncbi:MAG: NAD-dependent protein deacylase [Candidatus Muirbacterium halophilum]|nr:NAD-dependent protein deacylase [Candidatus Muirbacterium halophilum]MCK9476725.1 NAD-dependent protein deacylase [Candidatus Muirbacterium halophilum]
MKKIKILKDLIDNAKNTVVFTGAGISTNSGIPDFRSSNGIYKKYPQDILFNIDYFRRDPSIFYGYLKEILEIDIKITKMHKILAELEKNGKIQTIITQNIDNLHEEAGNKNIYEIHGSLKKFYCEKCGKHHNADIIIDKVKNSEIPKCSCDNTIRPDVVFFSEQVKHIQKCIKISSKSDLFIVIGSSLNVVPASWLPVYAVENKAKLVILNNDKTNLDNYAELIINEDLDMLGCRFLTLTK